MVFSQGFQRGEDTKGCVKRRQKLSWRGLICSLIFCSCGLQAKENSMKEYGKKKRNKKKGKFY